MLELLAESGLPTSLDVVEVNPILDRENNRQLAVELVASGQAPGSLETSRSRRRSPRRRPSRRCTADHLDHLKPVAQRSPVCVELFFPRARSLRHNEQRRDAQRLRRQRRRANSPYIEMTALGQWRSGTSVAMLREVLAVLLLEILPRRRCAGIEPLDNRLLGRVTRDRRVPVRRSRSRHAGRLDCRVERSARSIRSGASAASSSTRRPPNEWPIKSALRTPASSSVSSRSCTCVAIVQGGSHSELPWPRRSGASTRNPCASRSSASLRNRRP